MGIQMKDIIKKWLLIILGTISWSWTMVKSGWLYSFGMGFWGANGHDGIWHIALIESLARGSFNMPVFAGAALQNYHIGFDLILAGIHRLTGVPVVNLYFQIVPPLIAAAIGFLVYRFIEDWQHSKSAALWSTLFVYFGGGFAYLLGKGESAFWSTQAISTLINPPFAFSLTFLLLGLLFLLKLEKKFSTRNLILSIIFFGILIEIKAYAGALALGGLFVAGVFEIFKSRKWHTFFVFIGSLIVSVILFYPLNKNATGLLIWGPLWFLESMVAGTDRLYWPRLAEAMLSYKNQMVLRKFIPTYFGVFLIFYIGNLGTRIIKEILIWKWIRNLKSIGIIEMFISSVIVAGIVIPTLFIQKGSSWNTIQFFYYTLFFSGILAGITVSDLLQKIHLKGVRNITAVVIIGLTIPTTLITLKDVYIPGRPPAMLAGDEINALGFLAKEPDGVVLTYPFDYAASDRWTSAPKPLFLYATTAYVSAFSKKDVFLEDYVNLDITGYDLSKRLTQVKMWYKETKPPKAREFLKTNNIRYVYWVKPQQTLLGEKDLGLKRIFENDSVILFQVD